MQARGWAIDEAASDDMLRMLRKLDGRVCYTHAEGDVAVMVGEVEGAACGNVQPMAVVTNQ